MESTGGGRKQQHGLPLALQALLSGVLRKQILEPIAPVLALPIVSSSLQGRVAFDGSAQRCRVGADSSVPQPLPWSPA